MWGNNINKKGKNLDSSFYFELLMCAVVGGAEEEGDEVTSTDKEDLSEKQKHQLKHRELFLSRQVETLPATHIRGKCNIMLHNETELISSYLDKEVVYYTKF